MEQVPTAEELAVAVHGEVYRDYGLPDGPRKLTHADGFCWTLTDADAPAPHEQV